MIYVDSSVLLELYLSQPRSNEAREMMRLPESKVSSWLLAVEVPIVLRRVLGGRPKDKELLSLALAAFDRDSLAFNYENSLPDVAARVRSDHRFASCRALDAVHVCSALLIREDAGQPVSLASFDQEIRALCARVGLPTLPA